MIHFPRNVSVTIPFPVLAFNPSAPSSPWSGEAAHTTTRVMCLDNSYEYDFTNALFAATPAGSSTGSVACPTKTGGSGNAWNNTYIESLDVGTWPRGHYVVQIINDGTDASGNQQVWSQDFSVGVYLQRGLGYSAVYDGATLTVAAWVEENGETQTDYLSMTGAKIYNADGSILATLTDNTTPVNGIFTFEATVGLTAQTAYVLEVIAAVAGPATLGNWQFKLRTGIARP
jgi:hypothetical protein